MKLKQQRHGPTLRLTAEEKVLLESPRWEQALPPAEGEVALIVLDISPAEFVSILFLEGCVELARKSASRGRKVALLGPSPHCKRVLELVEGAGELVVLDNEDELEKRASSLLNADAQSDARKGVGSAEKTMLWG